jgi:hypothetical protein
MSHEEQWKTFHDSFRLPQAQHIFSDAESFKSHLMVKHRVKNVPELPLLVSFGAQTSILSEQSPFPSEYLD